MNIISVLYKYDMLPIYEKKREEPNGVKVSLSFKTDVPRYYTTISFYGQY